MRKITIEFFKDKDRFDADVAKQARVFKNQGMSNTKAFEKARKEVDRVAYSQSINVQSNDAPIRDIAEDLAQGRDFKIKY